MPKTKKLEILWVIEVHYFNSRNVVAIFPVFSDTSPDLKYEAIRDQLFNLAYNPNDGDYIEIDGSWKLDDIMAL